MVDRDSGARLCHIHGDQLHEGRVRVLVSHDTCDLDALHKVHVIGVDRTEPVHAVVRAPVGRGVAERAERVESGDGRRGRLRFHVLRLVDDYDGLGGLDELDRPPARHAVLRPIDDVRLCGIPVLFHILLERLYVHDEKLDRVGGRELTDPPELLGVIDAGVEWNVVVQTLQMLPQQRDAREHALADGDVRDDDDELGESITLVQLEDRAQVDVGLAGARLHLDREIHPVEGITHGDPIAFLHGPKIREDRCLKCGLVGRLGVADPQLCESERRARLRGQRELTVRQRQLSEKVNDTRYRVTLIVERRVELELQVCHAELVTPPGA